MKISGGKQAAVTIAILAVAGVWISMTQCQKNLEPLEEIEQWQEVKNPRKPDTFRIATLVTILSLHPSESSPMELTSMVHDKLSWYRYCETDDCGAINLAAMSYSISTGGKELVINLRKGMLFHDGSEVTAEDVAYSLSNILSVNNLGYQPRLTCKVLDRYTLQVNSPEWMDWKVTLGQTVLSKRHETMFTHSGGDYNPMGSGPYKFISYDKDRQVIRLERWDKYWAGPAPYKYIEIHSFDNPDAQTMALLEGRVDYCLYGNNEDINLVKANREFMISEMRGDFTGFLILNYKHPFFKDWRVRKALSLLIPREYIVTSMNGLRGSGVATDNIMDRVFPQNEPKVEDGYNPELADRLLKEAGYKRQDGRWAKNGVPLALTIQFLNSDFVNTLGSMRIVSKAFNDAGITCALRSKNRIDIVHNIKDWNFDAYFDLKAMPIQLQQAGFNQISCPVTSITQTCDEKLINLYEELFRASISDAPRDKLVQLKKRMQARFREISHVLPLFHTKCYVALRGTPEEVRRVMADPYCLVYLPRPSLVERSRVDMVFKEKR